jgi:hypothetical protein
MRKLNSVKLEPVATGLCFSGEESHHHKNYR